MKTKDLIKPNIIAKYFLIRAERDGDLITPLKMQKLVYFAYTTFLLYTKGKKGLFSEPIEAWPVGPVVPSLYRELKKYGSMPIKVQNYVDITEEYLLQKYPNRIMSFLSGVYEACGRYSAFELVALTHQERGWIEARKGLSPNEPSKNPILDKYILAQHLN